MKAAILLLPTLLLAQTKGLHLIHVIDGQTKRGVPLTELCATNNACFLTDSAGLIALNEPSFWNREVYFSVHSHGYEHARDFFGEPGRTIRVTKGGATTVTLTRLNIAERLYRVTGEGIYRDTIVAGRKAPITQPLLNSNVMGLDTFMHVMYQGSLFWLFGDTDNLSASLGNLATTCALSRLPAAGGLEPERGIDLNYFTDSKDFVKSMAAIPGGGMKWMFAFMILRDPKGIERLIARYDRMKSLDQAYDSGLAIFDDTAREFRPLVSFGPNPALAPYGRTTRVSQNGIEYFYFASPFPTPVVRVKADWHSVQNLASYEAYSCATGSCQWTAGAKPERAVFTDIDTSKPIDATAGSVQWNQFRRRWIAILQRNIGEVWYAEADTPVGPWAYAKKIVQHDRYTFYWPGQIAEFDRDGGRRIYFMGTYTHSFSGNPVKTPRYDYNQIMYALSLDDPRTYLPVAHYRVRSNPAAIPKEEIDRLRAWNDVIEVSHYEYPANRRPQDAKRLPVPDRRPMFDRDSQPVR